MVKLEQKRDDLAKQRTHLANERTLLAYWRTALSFLALAAFTLKFISSSYSVFLAIGSLILGAGLFFCGIVRYIKNQQEINEEN